MLSALLLGVVFPLAGGCSLVAKSTRPVPGEQRNLLCSVEYRPGEGGGPDLLFTAIAVPYKVEEVYMSLPDALVHAVLAPGRHLTRTVEVSGADCDTRRPSSAWSDGYRVPMRFKPEHGLRCVRRGSERVTFSAQTKYGACRVEIPEGDRSPRCHHHRRHDGSPYRSGRHVQSILRAPCPPGSQGVVRSGARLGTAGTTDELRGAAAAAR